MDRVPVLLEKQAIGELTGETLPDGCVFSLRCRGTGAGLYSAWAVGTSGELRLGVPDQADGQLALRRRFSTALAAPIGRLVRGELRSCESAGDGTQWQSAACPEKLFRSDFLRFQLRGVKGVLTRREGGCRFLALPFDGRRPFLLTSLFCFARVARINAEPYAIFAFDRDENPVFR